VFSFCKLRLRYHRQTHRHQHQGDIRPSARDYENKEITIYGTVTDATSMLIVKYFEIQDDTGKIKVVTDRLLPAKGEKLKVTGRTGIIEVGSERWVVLREKSEPDKSEKAKSDR
jgi:hypothetical protein